MLGFSVITSNSGAEGAKKATKEKTQLILMDIMIPKMDGREATRKIRSNPETQAIPILASTVLFLSSDLSSCIKVGCSDYIVKPFTDPPMDETENPPIHDQIPIPHLFKVWGSL